MNEGNRRGFTVQIMKSYANKFIAPSKFPITGNTVDVALGFDFEPWQKIVLLPWEVEKLTETLNEYLETEMTDKNAKPTPGDKSKGGNKANADQRKNWEKK